MALTDRRRVRPTLATHMRAIPERITRRRRRNLPLIVGGALTGVIVALSILAPALARFDPAALDPAIRLSAPGGAHPLGTDRLGRDVFSRVLYGGRVALAVGAVAVLIGAGAGVPIGLAAGYNGGRLDAVLMRAMDGLLAFPALLLAIMVIAALGPGHVQAMLAIGVVLIPAFARLARAQALVIRSQEYVLAAGAMGAHALDIIRRHVVPNIAGPLLIQMTVTFSGAMLAEASLSYLGLGTQPPTPSWGGMLQEARDVLFVAPWMAIWPGVAIAAAVLGMNLTGDGIRDRLDPRLTRNST